MDGIYCTDARCTASNCHDRGGYRQEAPVNRRYVTLDVFTDRVFGGNPLAVVLDCEGLSSGHMQSIASEFNYSETTFILPARKAQHTAQVRIFTPRVEVPFAGHPNVGTAVVLARELERQGRPPADEFLFEETAGIVRVRLQRESGRVTGAELTAPEALSVGSSLSAEEVARCLSLAPADIDASRHPPQVVSVGLAFLAVRLTSRDALRRARPDLAAHERFLPPLRTDAIFAYVPDPEAGRLKARMFAPLDGCIEDPATGSATAATIALLATLDEKADSELAWQVEQGVDMGRPSLLLGRTEKRAGVVRAVHVGGQVVEVMRGTFSQ